MRKILAATVLSAAAAAFAATPAHAASYGYECSIGRTGSDPCGGEYTVLPGSSAVIAMTSSGGKNISWTAKTSAGTEVGKVSLEAGDRKTIWTNHGAEARTISFRADASGLVNTRVTGSFDFG